jgi:putative phosphonate metabolism protein
MRYAIYFTPPADNPLVAAAEAWLGRSVFGRTVEPRDVGGIGATERAPLVASPARYGFHGTLKAPFRLAEGCDETALVDALDAFCNARTPLAPVRLEVASLDGFLALTPAAPAGALSDLAGEIVRHFDRFRAPLSASELAKRNPERLTPRQRDNLRTWGYPYIFDAFRFHMTLTERLEADVAARVLSVLRDHFSHPLAAPIAFDRLALYVEAGPGAPFTCLHEAMLAGVANPGRAMADLPGKTETWT